MNIFSSKAIKRSEHEHICIIMYFSSCIVLSYLLNSRWKWAIILWNRNIFKTSKIFWKCCICQHDLNLAFLFCYIESSIHTIQASCWYEYHVCTYLVINLDFFIFKKSMNKIRYRFKWLDGRAHSWESYHKWKAIKKWIWELQVKCILFTRYCINQVLLSEYFFFECFNLE